MRHDDAMAELARGNLWRRLTRSWLRPLGEPLQDHLRCDIGMPPLPSKVRIPMLVLAWLH